MSNNKTYDLEESVDRKKKNPKRTLRISLIVLLLLIIFALAFFVLARWPRYPAFEKKLKSYGKLELALSEEESPVLLDLSSLGHEDAQYYVRLDGRDLLSQAIGYHAQSNFSLLGEKINFSMLAEPEIEGSPSNPDDLKYRGVEIQVSESSSASAYWVEQEFNLDGFVYRLYSSYSLDNLDSEEANRLDAELGENLTLLTQQIIDKALR